MIISQVSYRTNGPLVNQLSLDLSFSKTLFHSTGKEHKGVLALSGHDGKFRNCDVTSQMN